MASFYLTPILQGLALNLSLIVAIGAQNTFVLRQGLQRQHILVVVVLSIALNLSLAIAGIYGVGFLISNSPIIKDLTLWGGALFLIVYGFISFKSAIKPKVINATANLSQATTLGKIVVSAFAFSWLNPHSLLDSVVLIGGIGGRLSFNQRPLFAFGVFLAELFWFSALALFARLLTPLFKKPVVWRWLDILVGCIMLLIAASLIISYFTVD